MGKLVSCKECGQEVSARAKTCPKCGVSNPGVRARDQLLAVGLIFGLVFVVSATTCNSDTQKENKQPVTQTITPEQEAEGVRLTKTKFMTRYIKENLKDPDSLQWIEAISDEKAELLCLRYRAKNSFGGYVVEEIILKGGKGYDKKGDWAKHCGPATYSVLKAAS